MSTPEMYSPPDLRGAIDAANREGFYEDAYRLLGKEMAAVAKDLFRTRESLAAALDRVSELEGHVGDWRSLALKYGTMTDVEKNKEMGILYGRVAISREVALYGRGDAITFACVDLAKKMRRQFTSEGTP